MKYDFSQTLIKASCVGQLVTAPRLKKDREAGLLGSTAKSMLIKVYGWEKYGRRDDLRTKAIKKGLQVEEEGITLVAKLDKYLYQKNETRLNNKWFTGEPDIFKGVSIKKAERIIDIKCSWDLASFLSSIKTFLNKDYYAQGQIYCDLANCSEFEISYCLINTPQVLINDEKKKLFYSMGVATEQNPDYLAACEELERNMTFDDIPDEEKRIKFEIQRDKEFIQMAREKVIKGREWLGEFQDLHLSGGAINLNQEEEE